MVSAREMLDREIFPYLPERLRLILALVRPDLLDSVVEIRLSIGQPLRVVLPERDYMLTASGEAGNGAADVYRCTAEDIQRVVQAVSKNSLYALEEELRMGYITMDGGHRIGLAGQAVMETGRLKAVKNISSLNIRVAREVKTCADAVMPYLFDRENRIVSCLVIAPPRCGKTTLLRDIARNFSGGCGDFPGVQVGVVDERSEIAACKNGVVTVDLGSRVDVLDGCPKAIGILMLIRTMAPAVIVTDELGREDDAMALEEALNAGVGIIASAHGTSLEDVMNRPHVGRLVRQGYFDRYVILSDAPRVGTVKRILSGKDGRILYADKREAG